MNTFLLTFLLAITGFSGYPKTELNEQTRMLEDKVVYEVKRNVILRYAPLEIESGKTGIIYIHKGCTLIVTAYQQQAAIHVPVGTKLVIAGDEGSLLKLYGGSGSTGSNGANGGNASTTWKSGKKSYAGGGGNGGDGGFGAAPAIGGHGGNGGKGGKGANTLVTIPFATVRGNNGGNGDDGLQGEAMGTVFVSGLVTIDAKRGERTYSETHRAEAGKKDESGYWVPFSYHKMNAGGGGGGGAGGDGDIPDLDIGGGAGGGGGGAGGGSGAFDAYGGKETKGHGSDGQGGLGGKSYSGSAGPQGYWDNPEPCGTHPDTYAGSSGISGEGGKPGYDGQLYAQSSGNFSYGTRYKMSQISAINYPLQLKMTFDNVLPGLPKPKDQLFYYGMKPLEKVTVPQSNDSNCIFAGYYLPDSTLVYNNQGQLTEAGKTITNCFHDLQLTAYWVGRAHVHLVLKYEQPNPSSKQDEYIVYPVDSFYTVMPEQGKHIQWCAKDYVDAPYHTDESKCLSVDLQPTTYYTDTFVYQLNRHKMYWTIPEQKGGVYTTVFMHDSAGARATQLIETLPAGRLVKEPQLYFFHPYDSLGTQVIGWSHKLERMPDEDITDNELMLKEVLAKIYVNKNDSGTLVVRNRQGVEVSESPFGESLSIQLKPAVGCAPNQPQVRIYKDGIVGDTLMVFKDDETHYSFVCSSTVKIFSSYRPIDYTTQVEYHYDSVPATGEKAHTWFVSKRLPTAVETDHFVYHYNDQITFASWLYTDSLSNWIVTPVVRTQKGDTIPVQWTLTDLLVDRSSQQHVWMPAYTFFAPADNVNITQNVYYRPSTTCTFFNHTKQTKIDSVFVNLNKVELTKDSTTQVRTLDIVSLQVNEMENSAVAAKAGYWDEKGQYQRLPLQVDKVETETGDFATVFSTMAPDRAMVMGLIDGPRIILQHCDSAVRWLAPSAAAVGDTVLFRLEPRDSRQYVQADSVLIYDINSQLVYRFDSSDAWANRFVMLDTTLYVYVYAQVKDHYHSVTFLNANGDTLQYQDWYLTGDIPVYRGNTPELSSDTTRFRWVFQGWNPQIHPVSGDDVYTATFKAVLKLNMFADGDSLLRAFNQQVVDIEMKTLTIEPSYYYSVSFPFDVPLSKLMQAWGEGSFVFAFTSTDQQGRRVNLNFSLVTEDTLEAGVPYLLKPACSSRSVAFESVTIEPGADTIRQPLAEYRATAVPTWLEERNYHIRFLNKNRIFWPLNCTGPLYGFGGYFYLLSDESAGPSDVYIQTDIDLDGDAVEDERADGAADPYSGEEQEVSPTELIQWIATEQPTGIKKILCGSQLLIIREGQVYNALGERIY